MSKKRDLKQLLTDNVDSNSEIRSDLVQFAALASAGDSNRARVFGMRRVRELMKTDPTLAHSLRNALTTAPATSGDQSQRPAIRRAEPAWESPSTGGDEEHDLLRIDAHPCPTIRPLYSAEVETALRSIVAEHQAAEALRDAGLTPTKTLLFEGPPGVGKTLAATWLAQQMRKSLFVLDLSAVMSRYLGATGANLKRAINYALQSEGVLFLDELDALAKRRDDTDDVGELKRLVTVLLQQLDEWPSGRLLVAATNHPQLLDHAVWRRFEARVSFPRPSAEELKLLMTDVVPPRTKVPTLWTATLPTVFANTSQSEFIRAFAQLRKATLLEPTLSPADALARAIKDRMDMLSRQDAKAIALTLAKEGSLSLRQISELTGVSRDTMRRAGVKGE